MAYDIFFNHFRNQSNEVFIVVNGQSQSMQSLSHVQEIVVSRKKKNIAIKKKKEDLRSLM